MQTHLVVNAINRLTVKRGEKKGDYYRATFSCKDVLDYMDFEIHRNHLRHVVYIATTMYPGSTATGSARKGNWVLNMKIRSK